MDFRMIGLSRIAERRGQVRGTDEHDPDSLYLLDDVIDCGGTAG
jgi:hypothetical protein